MKSKFGVITFSAVQMRSERIVLREPNYRALENSLKKTKRRIAMGKKIIIGFFILSTSTVLATVYLKKR